LAPIKATIIAVIDAGETILITVLDPRAALRLTVRSANVLPIAAVGAGKLHRTLLLRMLLPNLLLPNLLLADALLAPRTLDLGPLLARDPLDLGPLLALRTLDPGALLALDPLRAHALLALGTFNPRALFALGTLNPRALLALRAGLLQTLFALRAVGLRALLALWPRIALGALLPAITAAGLGLAALGLSLRPLCAVLFAAALRLGRSGHGKRRDPGD
jgi:hypothetical protein